MGCASSSGNSRGSNSKLVSVDDTSKIIAESKRTKDAKVVLLGESGVGKSSLALRFCQGRFSPYHEVTIGAAFLQQTVFLGDGQHVKLHIWDTGGQERFRAMAQLYYRDAHGAIIVYDSSYKPSFEAIKYWIAELRQRGPFGCSMVIAANKCDSPERQISTLEGKRFSQSEGIPFIECSAKNGENVGAVFEEVARAIASKMTD